MVCESCQHVTVYHGQGKNFSLRLAGFLCRLKAGSPHLRRFYGTTQALRTLDALHLGAYLSALTRGALVFVSADARRLDVGTLEGLQVLNPEIPAEKPT